MKHIFLKGTIYLLLIVIFCSGCGMGIRRNEYVNVSEFRTIHISVDSAQVEKLSIPSSQILKETNLNILKVKDGLFYGLGHGATGDGYRPKSVFKFNFNGEFWEEIEGNFHFFADAKEFPEESDIFYYFQHEDDSFVTQLRKMDYSNDSDEILLEFDENTTELDSRSTGFCIDGRAVYYLNLVDYSVYQRDFTNGAEKKSKRV